MSQRSMVWSGRFQQEKIRKFISVIYHKMKLNLYICILYDMLSYDKKYNGHQVAKKTGAEDANCG